MNTGELIVYNSVEWSVKYHYAVAKTCYLVKSNVSKSQIVSYRNKEIKYKWKQQERSSLKTTEESTEFTSSLNNTVCLPDVVAVSVESPSIAYNDEVLGAGVILTNVVSRTVDSRVQRHQKWLSALTKCSSDRSVPESTPVKSQATELSSQHTSRHVHGHSTQICTQHYNNRWHFRQHALINKYYVFFETKVIAATKEKHTLNITCYGAVVQQVDKFKYLGIYYRRVSNLQSQDQHDNHSHWYVRTELLASKSSSNCMASRSCLKYIKIDWLIDWLYYSEWLTADLYS